MRSPSMYAAQSTIASGCVIGRNAVTDRFATSGVNDGRDGREGNTGMICLRPTRAPIRRPRNVIDDPVIDTVLERISTGQATRDRMSGPHPSGVVSVNGRQLRVVRGLSASLRPGEGTSPGRMDPMLIDLHAHSTASDGTDSPAELMAAAAAVGLDVVAITDHDNTGGWAPALAARPDGLTVIRGAEFSTLARTDIRPVSVHLLGYLFDPEHPAIVAEQARLRQERLQR